VLTSEGKQIIRRYLGRQVSSIADAIVFGVGATAETATDASLALEAGRVQVLLTSYDFVNDAIIFKGSVPDDFVGTIYEVGIYSTFDDASSGSYGSRAITTFDSDSETWSAGTYTTTNTRIGPDSLNLAPATSGTLTASISNLTLDFAGNSGADQFILAFANNNTNASTVAFRFKTDASNYYTFSVSNPSTGYQVTNFNKSAAVATGTPNWSNITQVEVSVSSKATGASSVDFDAIRLEDRDTSNADYVLVARKVIAPVVKLDGQSQDIEFTLDVTLP